MTMLGPEQQQALASLVPFLDAETEKRLREKVADELVENFYHDILKVFPGWQVPPALKRKPADRMEFYGEVTTYGDLQLMLQPNYTRGYLDGMLPPPTSLWWLNLLSIPPMFDFFRRDMLQQLERAGRKNEVDA